MPEPLPHPDPAVRSLLDALGPIRRDISEIEESYRGRKVHWQRVGIFLTAAEVSAISTAVARVGLRAVSPEFTGTPFPGPLEFNGDNRELHAAGLGVAMVYEADDFPHHRHEGTAAVEGQLNATGEKLARAYTAFDHLRTALRDCVAVMSAELGGLNVIQRELNRAKAALALAGEDA